MEKLKGSVILITVELSRLGKSTAEVIALVSQLLKQKIPNLGKSKGSIQKSIYDKDLKKEI